MDGLSKGIPISPFLNKLWQGTILYQSSFQGISFGHAWVVATRPTEDWGPALPEHWPDIHKATQTDLPDHMGSTITVNGITPSYPGLQDEKHAYLNPGYSQDRF